MEKYPILNERLYLRSPSINVCFRVIIEGIYNKNLITEALSKVIIRHHFLNCSVNIDNDNNAWIVKNNNSINLDYYKSNEMDWQTWYQKNDNIPFNFLNGILVKYCVIVGENTEIIILGHRILGDGIGYLNVVKDCLLSLDNKIELLPQLPSYEVSDKYFKNTVLLDEGVHNFACGLNEEWKNSRVKFSENDYISFFEKYRNKYKPNFFMASIENENLKKLLENSKSNGFSVNEIIVSAFSLAFMKIMDRNEISLGVAANIRNELVSEHNNCMGNFVTGISTNINYNRQNDFISNAMEIVSKIKEPLENVKNRHMVVHFLNEFDKDLIESLMFAAYGDFEHSVSRKLAELIGEKTENKGLGISNLGRFEHNVYEKFNLIDLQFIGPSFPENAITVGVITVNNKMNICVRFNEGEIKLETIKIIYEKANELLIKSNGNFV